MIKRELEMHRLNTRCENRVQMAAGRLCSHAFNYGGHIGTHLIVGGFDVKGPQLIECSNDGNMYSLPFLPLDLVPLLRWEFLRLTTKKTCPKKSSENRCVCNQGRYIPRSRLRLLLRRMHHQERQS